MLLLILVSVLSFGNVEGSQVLCKIKLSAVIDCLLRYIKAIENLIPTARNADWCHFYCTYCFLWYLFGTYKYRHITITQRN